MTLTIKYKINFDATFSKSGIMESSPRISQERLERLVSELNASLPEEKRNAMLYQVLEIDPSAYDRERGEFLFDRLSERALAFIQRELVRLHPLRGRQVQHFQGLYDALDSRGRQKYYAYLRRYGLPHQENRDEEKLTERQYHELVAFLQPLLEGQKKRPREKARREFTEQEKKKLADIEAQRVRIDKVIQELKDELKRGAKKVVEGEFIEEYPEQQEYEQASRLIRGKLSEQEMRTIPEFRELYEEESDLDSDTVSSLSEEEELVIKKPKEVPKARYVPKEKARYMPKEKARHVPKEKARHVPLSQSGERIRVLEEVEFILRVNNDRDAVVFCDQWAGDEDPSQISEFLKYAAKRGLVDPDRLEDYNVLDVCRKLKALIKREEEGANVPEHIKPGETREKEKREKEKVIEERKGKLTDEEKEKRQEVYEKMLAKAIGSMKPVPAVNFIRYISRLQLVKKEVENPTSNYAQVWKQKFQTALKEMKQ